MSTLHTGLDATRWGTFSLVEQLANVGSEVERAIKWSQRGRADLSANALHRGLELLDLTIAHSRQRQGLKELTRLREALLDYFLGPNEFESSALLWHRYFHAFGMAAALQRERAHPSETPKMQPPGSVTGLSAALPDSPLNTSVEANNLSSRP